MDTSLRPMSTSEVLDRTFSLYRKNFGLFAGIALVAPTITLIARLVQLTMFGRAMTPYRISGDPYSTVGITPQVFARAAVAGMIALIIYMVGYAITTGATVHAVSMLHLGRTTSVKESYKRVKPIWGRLLLLVLRIFFVTAGPLVTCYAILMALLLISISATRGSTTDNTMAAIAGLGILVFFVAFIAAAVWGVIAYCRYALAVPACAVEGLPIKYSLIRSKFLSKGNLGRVFAVYLLTLVITITIKTLLMAPVYMSPGAFSFRTGLHLTPVLLGWSIAAEFLGALFAGPIAAIAMALVYYDERVRKEAFDLQVMMDSMKPAGPAQVAGV